MEGVLAFKLELYAQIVQRKWRSPIHSTLYFGAAELFGLTVFPDVSEFAFVFGNELQQIHV